MVLAEASDECCCFALTKQKPFACKNYKFQMFNFICSLKLKEKCYFTRKRIYGVSLCQKAFNLTLSVVL